MSNRNHESTGEALFVLAGMILIYVGLLWVAIEVILPWIVRVIKVTWEGA